MVPGPRLPRTRGQLPRGHLLRHVLLLPRYLSPDLKDWARSTYEGFLDYFLYTDEQGLPAIKDCCEVAGLGGKENRSGDYDYYINEKRRSNDPKGIGPYINASLEYDRLFN